MDSSTETKFWVSPIPEKVLEDNVIHAVKVISGCMEKNHGKILYLQEEEEIGVYVERDDYRGKRRVDGIDDTDDIPDKSSEIGIRLAVS